MLESAPARYYPRQNQQTRTDGPWRGLAGPLSDLVQAGILAAMPPDAFTDAERAALIAEMKQTVARDRFPLSQRIKLLRAILDRLEPPAPRSEPFPAPKPPGERSFLLGRKKRRR